MRISAESTPERVYLGKSGLRVSHLCPGTTNFGEARRGSQGDWTLAPDEVEPTFEAAIDRGLYYFDCANAPRLGACEQLDELVAATEIFIQPEDVKYREVPYSPVENPLSLGFP